MYRVMLGIAGVPRLAEVGSGASHLVTWGLRKLCAWESECYGQICIVEQSLWLPMEYMSEGNIKTY